MPHTLQSVRVARGHTRVEFLHTFRAVVQREVKLRTLRAWESGQNPVPAWVVDGYRAVLGLSDAEVVGVLASVGVRSSPPSSSPQQDFANYIASTRFDPPLGAVDRQTVVDLALRMESQPVLTGRRFRDVMEFVAWVEASGVVVAPSVAVVPAEVQDG